MEQKLRRNDTLGQNMQRLRRAAGLTQAQVAAKLQVAGLDVSRGMYAQMEQGTYSIRISVLAALKAMFKLESYDDFFRGL